MNIFVGNLPFSLSENELSEALMQFGHVESVKIITDRDSGRSRGFGFVEMPNDAEARTAIKELTNTEIGGRTIKINEAKPRNDRRY